MASPAPAVILVRPSEEGNIGAVARAMANTGLTELIVVEPAAAIGSTARAFAVGAASILDSVTRAADFATAIAPFQRLAATSSQRQRQAKTPVLAPRELPLALRAHRLRSALVFGPERSGLTTEELACCHLLVRIPSAPRQPTLNLAQAVLIVAYELLLANGAGDTEPPPEREVATLETVAGLLEHLDAVLRSVGFARDDTFSAVFRDLRRLALRAELTPREVQVLRGLLRRTEHALNRQTRAAR